MPTILARKFIGFDNTYFCRLSRTLQSNVESSTLHCCHYLLPPFLVYSHEWGSSCSR